LLFSSVCPYRQRRQLWRQIARYQSMMPTRRFPPPWTVEDVGGSFVVKASNARPLVFIYYREGVGRRSLGK
jgi:hypothetical protein